MSEMETFIDLQLIDEQGKELMRALEDFILDPDAKQGQTVDFLSGLNRFAYHQDSAYMHRHVFGYRGLIASIEVDVRNVSTDGEKISVSPYISHIKFENSGYSSGVPYDEVADITMIARDAIDID